MNLPQFGSSSKNIGPYISSRVMGNGGVVIVGQPITSIFSNRLDKSPRQAERTLLALAYSTPVTVAPLSNHPCKQGP